MLESDTPTPPESKIPQHLYVLPVLLLEFLALAITRAVLPSLLLTHFGANVYFVMGCVESVRGVLAFIACPLFGKVSDVTGRRICLFITVLGTCAPVCLLALMPFQDPSSPSSSLDDVVVVTDVTGVDGGTTTGNDVGLNVTIPEGDGGIGPVLPLYSSFRPPDRILVFVVALALSGVFSSTFTLTFAYISDTVREKRDRVSAYGLALATFGLSFTIGPMAGGYLATSVGEGKDVTVNWEGQRRVFRGSLALTVLDLLYIYFFLPESIPVSDDNGGGRNVDEVSLSSDHRGGLSLSDQISLMKHEIPRHWSPFDTLKIFGGNRLLITVAKITFLYYTGLYAVISTLVLYAANRFHLGPHRLGELMSAFGLCTVISEVVLVRIIVPAVGEKKTMRLGLFAFACQCVVLACAYEFWQLFLCVALSLLGNLVYPSLSSLVSASVPPESVGEVLGAVNGIKALTEGIGPLVFGILMTLSEGGIMPGWPYFLAAVLAYFAFDISRQLPDEGDEAYDLDRDLAAEVELKGLLDGDDDDDDLSDDFDEDHATEGGDSLFYDCTSLDDNTLSDTRDTRPVPSHVYRVSI